MRNHLAPAALVAAVFAAPVLWAGCAGGSSDPAQCTPVTESCNDVDDDCDGETDEAGATGCTTFFEDADSDGIGGASACLCAAAAPFTLSQGGDCDDSAASVHPGAAEACNGLDDDCDAQTDEGIAGCCAADATQPCGVAQGRCEAGTSTCSASFAWGPCLDAGSTPVVLPGDVAETCNGIDDDCDGETDEPGTADCTSYWTDVDADGFGTGSPVCTCAPSGLFTATDSGDCDDLRAGSHPGAVEACNGIDDDCDGQTDEGYGLGGDCSAGTGACAAAGSTICKLDGSGAVCDATPAQPGTESCNGIDDDCDGQTDEETADAGASCDGADADLCKEGTIVCEAATLVCNDQTADSLELCNGIDDDCDGQTDETPTDAWVGQSCCPTGNLADCTNTGAGTRCSAGAQTCSGGTSVCVGGVAKGVEACNGVDDDCNGATDDIPQIGAACAGGGANTTGACTAAYTCNGTPGPGPSGLTCAQLVGPAPELCNGIDDDCDGQTDESTVDAGAPCDGPDADLCSEGAMVCVGGTLACNDFSADSVEICDGIDDDCDGQTDEGYAVGVSCTAGIGACAVAGSNVCKVDGTGTVCGATPAPPGAELCNGIDDDCDGATDEPFGPLTDLDGSTHVKGNTCGVGNCAGGTVVCGASQTSLTCSTWWRIGNETCNGIDDDCDGVTDEPGSSGCSSYWTDADADGFGTGAPVCACAASGLFTATQAFDCDDTRASTRPGALEACNGIDDDCDGSTDESLSPPLCALQEGVCAGSRATCGGASGWQCTGASYGPTYEADESLCDGLDNDCDGMTDDPFAPGGTGMLRELDGSRRPKGSSCGYGRCGGGTVVCSASQTSLTCSTWGNAIAEICANTIDDDCDGQTDEGC